MKSWIFFKIKKYKKTSFLIFLFFVFLIASEIIRYLNIKEIETMTVADVSKVKTYQVFWGNPSNMVMLVDVPVAIGRLVFSNDQNDKKPNVLMIEVSKNIVDAIIQKDWQKVLRLMKHEASLRSGIEQKELMTMIFYNDGGILYKRATDPSIDKTNYNLYKNLRESAIKVNGGVYLPNKIFTNLVGWDICYQRGARLRVWFNADLIRNSPLENQVNLVKYAENLFSVFNPRIVDLSTGKIHGK